MVLAGREDGDLAPAGPYDPRGFDQCGEWIRDQLQHPHEARSVHGVVRDRELIDICDGHPVPDAIEGPPQHRLAQIEAEHLDAVGPQTVRDHPGAEAEFDHAGPGDPWCEVVGEVVTPARSSAGRVVDLGDTIERGPRYGPDVRHPN